MRPFAYSRAADAPSAIREAAADRAVTPTGLQAVQFLAGGTNIVDYMKLDVMRPEHLVDINDLEGAYGRIEDSPQGLKLGALVRMGAAQDHPVLLRDYPVIAQTLAEAASQQLRNMASLGGNVLQRTRCEYFRDVSFTACNKRDPGSGCAALDGVNRQHAILGVSDKCIASYPGDFAQALVALDAHVDLVGPGGRRTIRFEDLHRAYGESPAVETNLKPGELITGFTVPAGPWTRRSLYLKVRDRQSYAFALASAAVAVDLAPDGRVRDARIGLGGVASRPWRAREAEAALKGQVIDEASTRRAAEAAFAGATPRKGNAFKVELGKRTVALALTRAAALEV